MKRSGIWIALALVGIAIATGGGYWWGLKQAGQLSTKMPASTSESAERKVLYYRNPMGLPDTSPEPKKDSMGMDYTPVYADEVPANSAIGNDKANRKVLYYRNPMGLPDTSPVPKQDSMGMDYTPVYADEQSSSGQVKISPDKVQKLGVRTEQTALRDLTRTVRAVGQFQLDERRLHTVTTKFEGYIERLYVNATGQPVKRGQPLMDVYSPELVSAEEEYLVAWNGRQSLKSGTEESLVGVGQLAESALKRLRNWDISDTQLRHLQQSGKASRTLTLYSSANGVVLEKIAVAGMRFMPGEPLFKIADLSAIWLLADVFEQDLALVHVGQSVKISVDAYPDKEMSGKIAYIYPTVTPETRTAKVRIELANPSGMLRPDMYASVQLISGHSKVRALTVSDSAVIDSGTRQIVLVQLADGLFEPREVKLGMRSDGYVEVLQGLSEDESVVVRANFLIDAESNLKAALGSFGGHSTHGSMKPAVAESIPAPVTPVPAANHQGH
jgi:Cu(I)/Ag(I) efflux system membrane fusion protein